MKLIPASTLYDRIVSNMRKDYLLQKSLRLKEEAEQLAEQSRKQAAGRFCWQSQDEWDTAYKSIDRYYEEKRQFNDLKRKRPVQNKPH